MVKGNFRTVVNNLAFDKRNDYSGNITVGGCTLCVLGRFRQKAVPMNGKSVVLRNAADVAGRSKIKGGKYPPFPGRLVRFNVVGDVRKEVMDADNLDFRLRENSKYNKHKVGPYLYDPNSRYYWIPGRQLYKASTPVPPDGSTTVKVKSTKILCILGGGNAGPIFTRKAVHLLTGVAHEVSVTLESC